MDLGATLCTRTRPALRHVSGRGRLRRASTTDRVDELPSPRPRKALPHRALRVLLIEHGGEILFERRPPLGIWGGLWSLPELPLDADVRAAVKVALRGRRDAAR